MATWNMQQYDAAINDAQRTLDNQYRRQQAEFDQNYKRSEQQRLIDNEMNRRKVAAEQLKYDRDRQAVSDKRAALDYEFKDRARKRAEELAIAQHENNKQNLAQKQELAAATLQNQINTQNDIALQRNFSNRTYTPFQEAILKLKANGGNLNVLNDIEKDAIQQEIGYMLDEEAGQQFVSDVRNATPEYMREKGVNPDFVQPYIRQQRATAAKDAEYQRKNAPAIAKQKQQDQYNTVSGFMTGFYNDAVSSGSIDPKVTKSKDVVDAATRIFIASNGSLTPKQAFYQAAGIKQKNNAPTPPSGVSETENNQLYRLYGKAYQKLDDETKEKLAAVYSEWKEKYEPPADLTGDAYYQAAQRSAVAYQDLLKKYDLPTEFNTPIDEELYHLEYDNVHKELLSKEKALSQEFPRWYKWVKDNPNERIGNSKMMRNLVDDSMYEVVSRNGVLGKALKPEYQKFFAELQQIQNLRNHLVNREAWLKKLDANRRYGNK